MKCLPQALPIRSFFHFDLFWYFYQPLENSNQPKVSPKILKVTLTIVTGAAKFRRYKLRQWEPQCNALRLAFLTLNKKM